MLVHRLNFIVNYYFIGYMSPEYTMNGVVSVKIDVFSFEVLLLEIISGKKNNSRYHSEYPLNLIGHVSFPLDSSCHVHGILNLIANINE